MAVARARVGPGAGVHPEISLDVLSKGDAAPVVTVTVKTAEAGEVEAVKGQKDVQEAAAGAAVVAGAPAEAEAAAGAKTEP